MNMPCRIPGDTIPECFAPGDVGSLKSYHPPRPSSGRADPKTAIPARPVHRWGIATENPNLGDVRGGHEPVATNW